MQKHLLAELNASTDPNKFVFCVQAQSLLSFMDTQASVRTGNERLHDGIHPPLSVWCVLVPASGG